MSKTISILGATGSIGRQTLDVAEQLGLRVAALTAHMDVERLEAQVRKFRPRLAVLTDEAAARDLAVRLAVCRLALPEGENCPLIIDDALVNLDETRLEQAMELLRQIARERQVILFTCRKPKGAADD